MEVAMTINAKVQQKFEIQHSFPLEALENQVKESIITQFGEELASKVRYTTELSDDAIIITASLGESNPNNPAKKRTRRTKTEILAARKEQESSEVVEDEITDTASESSDSDVDISNNKQIDSTEAKKVLEAAGVELDDEDSLPTTKELTLEQYKTLKDAMSKAQSVDYDKVASVLTFENQHPDLVIKALYGDNPPKPVVNISASTLSDKVNKEEQEYITYFSWLERSKGHKVRIPFVDTPIESGTRVAPRRYIEVLDSEGTVLNKYYKYPNKAEFVEVTDKVTSNSNSWE